MNKSENNIHTFVLGAYAPLILALLPPNVKEPRGAYVWKNGKPVEWASRINES